MPTAGVTHDVVITPVGGSARGLMVARNRRQARRLVRAESQTLRPRVLTMGELTEAEVPAEYKIYMSQDNWQLGMGGRHYRTDPLRVADMVLGDISLAGRIRLARTTITSTPDSTPTVYNPSGFAISGEAWSFQGRELYRWDYTDTRWEQTQTPFAATTIYRNGVEYQGQCVVSRWADDAGSGGSYVAADEPCSYIHRSLTLDIGSATTWTAVDAANGVSPDAFKYFAVADNKLWGGYIADATDAGINTKGVTEDNQTDDFRQINASSHSFNHSVGATAKNVILVVLIAIQDGVPASAGAPASPTGVTYNSVAMTESAGVTSNANRASIWYLANPATGSNAVAVTFGTTMDRFVCTAISFMGVDTSSPVETAATASGYGMAETVNVTTVADQQIVIDCVTNSRSGDRTPGADQTLQRYNKTTLSQAVSTKLPSGTTTTMSYTLSDEADWAIVALPINSVWRNTTVTDLNVDGNPSAIDSLAAGDVIRVDAELMLVTAVDDTDDYITVVRAYRGTIAAAHNAGDSTRNVYEITENVHHVRSTTDPTSLANWTTHVAVGDSSSEITGMIGVGTNLIVFKTDGVYRVDDNAIVTELRPQFRAQRHPDNFKGAFFGINDRIILPMGAGGMFELETGGFTLRNVSFSDVMPDLTDYHGRVVVGQSELDRMYILVLDSGNTRYDLFCAEFLADSAGASDYRWSHVGRFNYTTGTDADHATVFIDSIPSGSTIHHRILIGIESTGSSISPSHIPLSDDVADAFTTSTDPYANFEIYDALQPRLPKTFAEVDIETRDLDSSNTIQLRYRVDGGSWTNLGAIINSQPSDNVTTREFSAGTDGKIVEVQAQLRKQSADTTTPSILSIRITATLRPASLRLVTPVFYVADNMQLLNGAIVSASNGDLTNLRTWNGQADEVTVALPGGVSYDAVFLTQAYREEEVGNDAHGRPEYLIHTALAEV